MGPELSSAVQRGGSPSLAPAWWVWCHLLWAQPSSGLVTLLPMGSNLIRRHEGTISLHGSSDKMGWGTKRAQGHQPLSFLGRGS